MASATKRASAGTDVNFRDLKSKKNPWGGIKYETRVKTG
jgi:hypothetical protein